MAKDSRVFEMRTYYAAPGKLEDLQARFRDHTVKLFEKHGMTNIGYWVPVDEKTGQPSATRWSTSSRIRASRRAPSRGTDSGTTRLDGSTQRVGEERQAGRESGLGVL